jgi:hypothetical protein
LKSIIMAKLTKTDEFGIEKKYEDSQRPTKARDWFMGKDNFRERIAIKKWLDNNQGQFETDNHGNEMYVRNKDSNKQVRLNVFATSNPEEEPLGENRFSITKKKDSNTDASTKGGFLFRPQDWRDLEITCYIYVNKSGNPDDNYAWYVRGGYQGDDDFQECSSCKYSPSIEYKPGSFSAAKKTEHGTNYHRDPDDNKITIFDGPLGDTRGKWIGYKAIVYNQPPVGTYPGSDNTPIFPVKIEIWTDSVDNEDDENGNFIPHNQWIKKMETMDNPSDNKYGKWGEDSSLCNAPDYVTLSWGGPIVTFRIDKAGGDSPYNNFRLKYASIREIEPGIRTE